jgi:hypothetical protein
MISNSAANHIEGVAELALEAQPPGRHETTGRLFSVVAGARYDLVETFKADLRWAA